MFSFGLALGFLKVPLYSPVDTQEDTHRPGKSVGQGMSPADHL